MPKARVYLLDGDMLVSELTEEDASEIIKKGFVHSAIDSTTFYPSTQIQRVVVYKGIPDDSKS